VDVKDALLTGGATGASTKSRIGAATAWDRYEAMLRVRVRRARCVLRCLLHGPCRIDPFGEGALVGHAAHSRSDRRAQPGAGRCLRAAAHSDTGGRWWRSCAKPRCRLEVRLRHFESWQARCLAAEWGIATSAGRVRDRRDLAAAMAAQFGRQDGTVQPRCGRRRAAEAMGASGSFQEGSTGKSWNCCTGRITAWNRIRRAAARHAGGAGRRVGWIDDGHDRADVLFGGRRRLSRANLGVLEERSGQRPSMPRADG